jgi:CRISPR system Cascade subunit CasB
MTEETSKEAPTIRRVSPDWITRPVDAAHHAIAHMGTGDRAALRKLQPGHVQTPAFWRLSTSVLADFLPQKAEQRGVAEDRWAVILPVMESALHAPGRRLGAALVAANVSEMRVTRLLRARGESVADAVRAVGHQLIAAGAPFDHADLAWLVLSEGHADDESCRRQIARDYYGALAHD